MFVSFLVQSLSILIQSPIYVRYLALDGLVGVNKGSLRCEILLINGLHFYLLLLQFLTILNEPILNFPNHLLGDSSAVSVYLRGEVVYLI